jgi:hypothetical protein
MECWLMTVRVPIEASLDVQRAVIGLNDEISALRKVLNGIDTSSFSLALERVRKDLEALKKLPRIPPPGQRAFTGSGQLFLDDRLNWSGPGQDVGLSTVTTSRTVTGGDYILLVDCTAGNVTLTLPAANLRNQMLYIKKVDNTVNKVIIAAAGSDKIDGYATQELLYEDEDMPIVADGVSEWDVL